MAPASERIDGLRTHGASWLVQGLLWGATAAVGALGAIGAQGGEILRLGISVVGAFVLGVGAGFASWWFTRYVIDGSEVRINSGVLTKKSRRIPYERLQSVDIVEPLLARLLGLAELRIEVAGGRDSKASLRFLKLEDAKELRRTLLQRAQRADADGGDDNLAGGVVDAELIARVPPEQIMIGTLLSLDFVLAVVLAVALLVSALWFEFFIAAVGGIIPVVGALVQMIGKRVIAQWGFTLSRTDQGLRIRRGLLSRSSQTVPFDRVQGVSIKEPFVWRRFGWQRLEVDVAGYASDDDSGESQSSSILLPIADAALAQHVLEQLIPGIALEIPDALRPPRESRLFAPIGWKFRAVAAGPKVFVARSGWIQRTTDIVPHHKTQSVSLAQGPLQRRLGLATIEVHTPKGPVNARGKNLEAAPARHMVFDQLQRARAARALSL